MLPVVDGRRWLFRHGVSWYHRRVRSWLWIAVALAVVATSVTVVFLVSRADDPSVVAVPAGPLPGEPYGDGGTQWRPHPDRVGLKRRAD
jgi:hypothetical protein